MGCPSDCLPTLVQEGAACLLADGGKNSSRQPTKLILQAASTFGDDPSLSSASSLVFSASTMLKVSDTSNSGSLIKAVLLSLNTRDQSWLQRPFFRWR